MDKTPAHCNGRAIEGLALLAQRDFSPDLSTLPQAARSVGVPQPHLDAAFERLLSHSRLAVVHGASNQEPGTVLHRTHNPRSWKSYSAVATDLALTLRRLGFANVDLLAEGMDLPRALRDRRIHLSWLNSGGVQGHGPMCHASAVHESLGIPYVGHRPASAALMDDKPLFKGWLQGMGIPTAPFVLWHPSRGALPAADDRSLLELERFSEGPLIVKPASGRASQHVVWVASAKEVAEAVAEVHGHTRDRVMIEPYLAGREYCIAVAPPLTRTAGGFLATPRPVFPAALERCLDPGERVFTSLDKRAISASRVRILDAAQDASVLERLESIAEKTFGALGLDFIIRLDVREDRNGNPMVLEANPKPDLAACREGKRGSLIALGLASRGMSYDDLIACQVAYRLKSGVDYCPQELGPIRSMLPWLRDEDEVS
ncbi:MAG: D-alanyl-alanine synthetase [Acidobacteriota bacterium]